MSIVFVCYVLIILYSAHSLSLSLSLSNSSLSLSLSHTHSKRTPEHKAVDVANTLTAINYKLDKLIKDGMRRAFAVHHHHHTGYE